MKKSTRSTAKKTSRTTTDPKQLPHGPHRLADAFLRERERQARSNWWLLCWRDEWWEWDGQKYRVVPESELRSTVVKCVQAEFVRLASYYESEGEEGEEGKAVVGAVSRGLVSDILQALQSLRQVPAAIEPPAWVGPHSRNRRPVLAMTNGLLDIRAALAGKKATVRPHSPEWFSPVCITYAYDPTATCPKFLAFLDEIFKGDHDGIALVQEWFGYCLVLDTSLHKCLILVGEGDNGKSVLLQVLIALLGEANISHVPLELFGKRFQLAATIGKLANIVAEIGPMDRVAEGMFKQFVAGDPMHVDRKNRAPIDMRPTARMTLATNVLPPFADPSHGLWRRLLILPCDVIIPPERQDKQLATKLMAELPGIFNWALTGRQRVSRQGHFTVPAVSQAALSEYRDRYESGSGVSPGTRPACRGRHRHVYRALRGVPDLV